MTQVDPNLTSYIFDLWWSLTGHNRNKKNMSDLLMCTIPIFYNLNAYLRFLAPKSRPFSSSQRPENFFWGYSGAFSPPAGFQYTANSFELRAVVSYSIDSRLKFFKKRMVENLNTYFITFMAKTAYPQTLLRHHTIYKYITRVYGLKLTIWR